MSYLFTYEILDYTNEDVEVLFKKFIPHLIKNANTEKNTLDSVRNIRVNLQGANLVLDLDVVSNSAQGDLNKAIHGGLGNTFGKGRVV